MVQLQALNPTPMIDSAKALVERLQGASLRSLGLGVVRSVRSLQTTVSGLTTLGGALDQMVQDVGAGVEMLQQRVSGLANARASADTSVGNNRAPKTPRTFRHRSSAGSISMHSSLVSVCARREEGRGEVSLTHVGGDARPRTTTHLERHIDELLELCHKINSRASNKIWTSENSFQRGAATKRFRRRWN